MAKKNITIPETPVEDRERPVILRKTDSGDVVRTSGPEAAARLFGLDAEELKKVLDGKKKSIDGFEAWYAESPVYDVRSVPIEKIQANTYNPNHVAPPEMKLLYDSIKEDGYTMPIVCYYMKDQDMYEIVDGYHRYTTMLLHKDIRDREHGCLPVVVIDKDISNRIASTVRHNRARGTHDIDLMVNIVRELQEEGMGDAWMIKHLGMDAEELLRLKQISGLASLFADRTFTRAWDDVSQPDEEQSDTAETQEE